MCLQNEGGESTLFLVFSQILFILSKNVKLNTE